MSCRVVTDNFRSAGSGKVRPRSSDGDPLHGCDPDFTARKRAGRDRKASCFPKASCTPLYKDRQDFGTIGALPAGDHLSNASGARHHSRTDSPKIVDKIRSPSCRQSRSVDARRQASSGDERPEKPELPVGLRRTLALGGCVAWMAVSSGLILINKYLMSSDNFRYPMALSGLGMAFSSVASWLVCRVFRWVDARRQMSWGFWATKILPVGLFMALTLHFGNVVYLYLSVSFIQMLKAFTPIVTMVALFVSGLEVPSRRLVASVSLIAIGTAVASYGEINLSAVGVAFMFLSESFEATRLVMTQVLLVGLKFHPIEGLMYLAPACTMWLALGVFFVEWPAMARADALGLIRAKPLLYLSAAAMGFGVNALAYVVIQATSSLTLKVLGTVKNALVVMIGIALLGDLITGLQGLGYVISLAAFAWYNYLKLNPTKSGVAYSMLPTKDSDADLHEKGGEPLNSHGNPPSTWQRISGAV